MIRHAVLLLCTCLLWVPLAGASVGSDQAPLGTFDMERSTAHLSVTRGLPDATSIALDVPEIVTNETMVDYQTYQVFSIPGEPFAYENGCPAVPQVTRFYRIPNTGNVEVRIITAEYDVVDNVDVLPVTTQDPGFNLTARRSDVYESDAWYPAEIAVPSSPVIMRDFRLVTVTLNPVQVNPVTRQARIYRNIQVDLVATGGQGENELLDPPHPISRAMKPLYESLICNLDESALDEVSVRPGNYYILTHSNNDAARWADSLFVWKTQLGYNVHVEARSNWSVSSIRTYIQARYAVLAERPDFVCLIGDPDWTLGMPSDDWSDYDHGYALGNNNDNVEDIAVGRLSGNSSQMAVINSKIMGYERNPFMADTMWYHRSYHLASVANSCASNYTLMQWGGLLFRSHTDVDSNTVEYVNGSANPSRVQQMFNTGVSFFFWRGSWLGQMDGGIVDPMSNGFKLPICLLVTCGANNFIGGTGTAEAYLQKGTVTAPKGGVASCGTSSSGTHNPPNQCLAAGLQHYLAGHEVDHLGQAVMGAKAWLWLVYPNDYQSLPTYFNQYFNLMGDPGLYPWTQVPVVMEVTHPTVLNVGARQISVQVVRDDNGVPVGDAMVTAWKRGADSTYSYGRTDDQGNLTLPITVNAPGDLMLTISKRNHKPYLYTLPCVSSDNMAMLSSYTPLDDDNAGGTSGNNDHIVNPGETIDIPLYIKNFGVTSTATGITAVLTSANPRITVVQGSATYANLAPGDSALGSAPFRISVSPQTQNTEEDLLTVSITSNMGQAAGSFVLTCSASAISHISHTVPDGTFDPGTVRHVSVTIQNTGNLNMNGVTGRLVSLSPFVQVDQANSNYPDMAMGVNGTNLTQFQVSSNSLTFRGHQAPMLLITTTAGSHVDTTNFILNVGTALTTDPTGPDGFGYFAYDNTDVSYEMRPTFDYADISTGQGTNLNLNDQGDKTSPTTVTSTWRHLPFGFKFYGVVYDTITICSNGWVAFGNQAWNDVFRNFPIPGATAPEAMIAPYWDDLATAGSGRGVWEYYDAANHRYIVQWKAGAGSSYSTALNFEVILYDTTYHPTLDGHGYIDMQYQTVQMGLPSPGSYNYPGCSIGVQAPRGVIGLGYVYSTAYSPGAATVANGRAIRFTTSARMLFGSIEGIVTDAETSGPLPAADVTIDGHSYHATSDAAGHYRIDNILIGTYNLRSTKHRYNVATTQGILVELDSVSSADFTMYHPEMRLSTDAINLITTPSEPIEETFNVINDGNGPLDYNITVYYAGDENPNPWDSVGALSVTDSVHDFQIMGCEFANDNWWVTGGGGPNGENLIYRFDYQGHPMGSIPQPSSTSVGWFDMAFDGELLYGSDGSDIVGIDPTTGDVLRRFASPLNPTRAIAIDQSTMQFWVADYTSDIFVLDTLGNILGRYSNPASGQEELAITGLAWNPTDLNGYKLYIFSQNGTSRFTRVTRMHPLNRLQETVIDLPGRAGDRSGGCTITPGWNSTLLVFAGVLQNPTGDRIGIYEMSFNTTWISVTPAALENVPGGTQWTVRLNIDPGMLRPDEYRVSLHVNSVVYDTTMFLPVTLHVNPDGVETDPEVALPTEYALRQNYPNPFNPTTMIGYDLRDAGFTKLAIYNLLGEKVTELVNGWQPAGSYQVPFEAANLPTGMYFYRLESGSFTDVQKMVLMK